MKTTFIKTATLNGSGKFYEHFGIHPVTCSVYGNKESEIEELELKVSDNQTILTDNNDSSKPDYWGWYDLRNNEWSDMIYAARFLLNMCFPSGIINTEESGQGKAYRLEIINK